MHIIDIQFDAIPGLSVPGRDEKSHDNEGETRELIADGFLFEGDGFSVRAEFPAPVMVEQHRLAWDGGYHSTLSDDREQFLAAITKLWPSMAAHV